MEETILKYLEEETGQNREEIKSWKLGNCLDLIQKFTDKQIEAISVTRCSTQLKLVYTSDFCKWLETGFTYYDKTSDFLSKTGYRMTFKELVNKYEQEQNKKALIV